ncbi:cyclic nucleotide-binding domain-containing protein [Kiloniella antarctica]|uniref:Cyclic nucleotide-binding domain-containing protein n=1 Tax=Kiloniella antarctica TaxID=1550907 RepID=A0ABW5BIF9_9PROT
MDLIRESYSNLPAIFVFIGFLLTFIAFVISDILWLRIFTIVAKLAMAVAALLPESGPMWLSFTGNMLLITVNVVHSALLILERRRSALSNEEQELKNKAFPSMDRVFVKRLFAAATWYDLGKGDTLLVEGERPDKLFLFLQGRAFVSVKHKRIGEIGPGQFVGEMSFLTRQSAGATVVTRELSRCLVWQRNIVEKLSKKDRDLEKILTAAIGVDLAGKIFLQNQKAVGIG